MLLAGALGLVLVEAESSSPLWWYQLKLHGDTSSLSVIPVHFV